MMSSPRKYEATPPRNEFPGDRVGPKKNPASDEKRDRFLLWQDEWRADRDSSDTWRRLCKEWLQFIAGKQWTQQDLEILNQQRRVPVTINLSKPIITMVRGQELQSREDIIAFGREAGDARVSEVATAALDYVRDQCDASFVWSEAFNHMLQCGMGWVGCRIDYDEDPEGKLIDETLDPLSMYWDYAATSRNLRDARRIWQVQIMDVDAARDLVDEDLSWNELDADWTSVPVPGMISRADRSQRDYRGNKADHNPGLQQVRIVERQWSELRDIVLIHDPRDNSVFELDPKDVNKFGVQGLVVGKARKKVYRKAIIGRTILHEEDLGTDSLHFQCMTALRDDVEGYWYGMTPCMMDPQRWANNFLAQTIHIYKTMGKGGLLYETGAFRNPDHAISEWSKASGAVEVNPNKLDRILEKPSGQLPAGFVNMIPLLIDMIRQSAGVNPEMLGMTAGSAATDPSGMLELQRKEAGMTMLAEYFDAMALFRRMHGRLHLDMIVQFLMSEKRLIRIVGEEGAKYVPMLLDGEAKDYDLITEGVPTSPTNRQRNWTILQPILPMLAQLPDIPPEIWVEVAKISPLPPQFAEKMAEVLTNKNPTPEQMEKQKQEEELQLRGLIAQIMKEENQAKNFAAQAELNYAKAQATGEEIQLKALDGIQQGAQAAMPGEAPRLDPNKAADRDFQGKQADSERQFKGQQAGADRQFKGGEAQAERGFKGQQAGADRQFQGQQGDQDRLAKTLNDQISNQMKAREGDANRMAKSQDQAAERVSRERMQTRQSFADNLRATEDRGAKMVDSREQRDFQKGERRANNRFQGSEAEKQREAQATEGKEGRDFEWRQGQAERKAQQSMNRDKIKAQASKPKPPAAAGKSRRRRK